MPWRPDFPNAHRWFWAEVCVRVLLVSFFVVTEDLEPFNRVIQPEEQWLYKFPRTSAYITTTALYCITIPASILVVLVVFAIKRNYQDAWAGLLVPSLALPLTGLFTNIIKLSVGRPRPDFFDRCYPGVKNFNASLPCTGDPHDVMEGKKSFPSGHSSNAFCSFIFVSLYLAGQLGVFNGRGRGQGWRVLLCMVPVVLAILMAISRTDDYHHHWQDVTVGAIIGTLLAYISYRQYFPCLSSESSDLPYMSLGSRYQYESDFDNPYSKQPYRRSMMSQSALGNPVKLI
ncbi:unnamed protein product [Allacma fusca]|uniref:Phosphatidic acid phosphatase type 2/haloperoxidase domain-containing protein n=1 Tax=Allacma fusca TaxID=39272 RepID=A0A8J2PYH8_9HEXA|nr:unnamed protein product [Allacma fusca]